MKKKVLLVLFLLSVLSIPSVSAMPTLTTTSFPVGTYVIPMDEKQSALTSGDVTVYGFIWAILDGGADIYRIIEPPDETLYTTTNPGGAVYSGGVILVMAAHGAIIAAEQANFPTVVVDTLTQPFTSDKVLFVDDPTNILVIHGVYGHTDVTLDWMGIPYTKVETSDVEADPDMLLNYDLVVDDCPGWAGMVPGMVAIRMVDLANNGGEIIFNDISLLDLTYVFPDYVMVGDNVDGTWDANIHNPPITGGVDAEYPSQYSATFPTTVKIYTMFGGKIIRQNLNPNVRVIMDSSNYDGNYRILACYFPYGAGLVEAFAYHPQEQTFDQTNDADSYVVSALLYGNKFVTAVPPEPEPEEEHDVEAVSQTAIETSVEPGTQVDIEVTVRNNGDFTETFDVTCYYDGTPIGTQTITLASGASTTVTFTWDTTGVPLNEYLISAWADSGEAIVEVDELNNWCDMPLPIFMIPELPLGTVMALISTFAALVLFRKRPSIKM